MKLRTLALAFALVACGGDTTNDKPAKETPAKVEKKATPTPKPKPTPPPAVVAKPDADGVVHIEATDMMKYNANRIEVEGTTVKIELKHVGKMPKNGMGHNLVVLKPGTNAISWASGAIAAAATEYIPAGDAAIVAHTKLLGGGDSDTIEFTVPGPGEYPFVCSFPGHAAIMNGVLVVK